jgi:hypothetical protein
MDAISHATDELRQLIQKVYKIGYAYRITFPSSRVAVSHDPIRSFENPSGSFHPL